MAAPWGAPVFQFQSRTQHDFAFLPDEVAEFMRSLPEATLSENKEKFLLRTPE